MARTKNFEWIVWWVFLLVLTLAVQGQAAVPEQLNYQGRLTNSSGVPVNGLQMIRFVMFTVESEGTRLWQEIQTIEAVDGIFNALLGAVTPFSGDEFENSSLYLEIAVFKDGSGWDVLSPRQKITSTAYAVKAANSDAVAGFDIIDLDSRYVNEGSDVVTSSMITDGTVTSTDLADGTVINEIKDDDGAGSKLDADFLDGHDSGHFMTATTDRWVNTAGDTMTGSLEVENSITIGTGSTTGDDFLYMDSGNEHLRWDADPGRFYISDDLYVRNSLQVGWSSVQKPYSVFGSGGTNHSDDISQEDDLLVNGDFEVNGRIFADTGEFYLGTSSGTNDDYIFVDGGLEKFGWKNDLDEYPGNGENGGYYFSDELEVTGSIHTDGSIHVSGGYFRYSSPRSKSLSIPAIAFIKSEHSQNAIWAHSSSGYRYLSTTGTSSSCTVYAPVYLPEGATVQQVSVRYADKSSSKDIGITFRLKAAGNKAFGFPPVPTATVWTLGQASTTSSGSALGISTLSTSDIDENNDTITNIKSYFLEINWTPTDITAGSSLRCYGAQIYYTIDKL